jgi:dTDP-4-dehydrorhamnose reductase
LNRMALVIRTGDLFGPGDRNRVLTGLKEVQRGNQLSLNAAPVLSPTHTADLIHATLDLLIDGETGVWHLSNSGQSSWFDLARRAANYFGFNETLIVPQDGPATMQALMSERAWPLPSLENAFDRYLRDLAPSLSQSPAE